MPIPLLGAVYQYKRVTGSDPAANTECSDTVPPGKAWWLLSVTIQLAQGATQTPQPYLVIDDGTTTHHELLGSTAVQAASTTTRYHWAPSLNLTAQLGAGATVRAYAPLPDYLILPGGWRIRTATVGLGANSDFGAPSFHVLEMG